MTRDEKTSIFLLEILKEIYHSEHADDEGIILKRIYGKWIIRMCVVFI
jgi:hypothetical protein